MPEADDASDVTPLCRLCLETWLHDWPEDGARVEPLESSPATQRALLRAVCSAMKLNRELLDVLPEERQSGGGTIPEDEADQIFAVRTTAQGTMNHRRVALEPFVSA